MNIPNPDGDLRLHEETINFRTTLHISERRGTAVPGRDSSISRSAVTLIAENNHNANDNRGENESHNDNRTDSTTDRDDDYTHRTTDDCNDPPR